MQELNEQRYQKQKDELQALESIFGEDIIHSTIETCWKVRRAYGLISLISLLTLGF